MPLPPVLDASGLPDSADVPQRCMVHWITADLLMGVFGVEGWFRVVENPVPADAKVVNVAFDPSRKAFALLVESESYPETPPGKPYPLADVPLINRFDSGPVWSQVIDQVGRHMQPGEWSPGSWPPGQTLHVTARLVNGVFTMVSARVGASGPAEVERGVAALDADS